MFQAYERARLPIIWKDVGASVYSYTELTVNSCWFYVDCELSDGLDTVFSVYLLSLSSQIKDLNNSSNIKIRSVYIVSPPYINGTESWKMNPLAKVSVGKISYDDCENKIEIYELKSGEILYSSSDANSDVKIDDIKVVYS